jgi:hypothetical protein
VDCSQGLTKLQLQLLLIAEHALLASPTEVSFVMGSSAALVIVQLLRWNVYMHVIALYWGEDIAVS